MLGRKQQHHRTPIIKYIKLIHLSHILQRKGLNINLDCFLAQMNDPPLELVVVLDLNP